ncbi:hypothetical protein D3C75_786570 [compost metagenome]
MPGLFIADHDIAGIAAGAYFFHQFGDFYRVVFFHRADQRGDQGNLSCLHLRSRAEIAVQLGIELIVGIGANKAQQQAGEGDQAQE